MPNGLADRHRRLALPPVRVACGGGAPPLATHGRADTVPAHVRYIHTHIHMHVCVSLSFSKVRRRVRAFAKERSDRC